MKRIYKTVVIAMCIFSFLSLFGCNKDKYILDGPGMVRVIGWKSFTISRCSAEYEPIYSYTVVYDQASCEGHLYCGTYDETQEQTGIRLAPQTINDLFNLELLELPDEESVTGNFLSLSVVDENGLRIPKKLSTVKEAEILALIQPYVEDGNEPNGSERESDVWQEFTISQTSDVYEENFAYTVTKEDGMYYLSYDYFDYKNKVPDERKVKLEESTVNSLLAMDLLSLPNEEEGGTSADEPLILDGTWAKLTITDDFGDTYKKSVSDDMVQAIRSLLTPYVVDEL